MEHNFCVEDDMQSQTNIIKKANKLRIIVAVVAAVGLSSVAIALQARAGATGQQLQILTPTSGSTVSTATPTLLGTGPANQKVQMFVDGSAIASQPSINASGDWSYTPSALSPGTHTIRASENDGAAYISNRYGINAYGVFNTNSMQVVGKSAGICALGQAEYDATDNKVFIADICSAQIHVYDPTTDTFTSHISMIDFWPEARVGRMYYDASRGKLYVVAVESIVTINASSNVIEKRVTGIASGSHDMVVSPTSDKIYIYGVSGNRYTYSRTTDTLSAPVSTGSYRSFIFSKNGAKAFYALESSSTVLHAMNPVTDADSGTLTLASAVQNMLASIDNTTVYVCMNNGSVAVVNATALTLTTTIVGGCQIAAMQQNSTGTRLYTGTKIINTATNAVVATTATGVPFVDSTNTYVYVTPTTNAFEDGVSLFGATQIQVYDATTGASVKTIAGIRSGANRIIFIPATTKAYVINRDDKSVTQLNSATATAGQSISYGAAPMQQALLSADATKLFTITESAYDIQVVSANSGAVVGDIHLPGRLTANPQSIPMAFNADKSALYVYVTDRSGTPTSHLVTIDTTSYAIVHDVVVATYNNVQNLAIDEAHNHAFIDDISTGIKVINLTTGAYMQTVGSAVLAPTGTTRKYVMDKAHSTLYAVDSTNAGTIVAVDTATLSLTHSRAVGSRVMDIALSPDNNKLYATVKDATTNISVSEMDTSLVQTRASGTVSFSGTAYAGSVSVAPNGWLYITDAAFNLTVVDNQSLTILRSQSFWNHTNDDLYAVDTVLFDPNQNFSDTSVTFTVPIEFTTTDLPDALPNVTYSQAIATTLPGATFSITTGSLPNGLSLNPSNGTISGTPTQSGVFTFTLQASGNSLQATKQYSITVAGRLSISGSLITNYDTSVSLDPVHHRLFVGECGTRVLIYDLDANNMLTDTNPDFVLGQTDFVNTSTLATSQSSFDCVAGLAYDEANDRLYVSDQYNSRVMVFDTSTITNGMNAQYVLGEPDFTSVNSGLPQKNLLYGSAALAYDPNSHYLYVADAFNSRVMVFDTHTLSNGMDASYVLGQPDFTSNYYQTTQNRMTYVTDVAIDSVRHRLYVGDSGSSRVLVFDTNALANDMDASFVIGQPDFTTDITHTVDNKSLNIVSGLWADSTTNRLYVSDASANRVLIFDTSNISNNQAAQAVIAQSNFAGSAGDTNDYSLSGPGGLTFDPNTQILYVADSDNFRLVTFDIGLGLSANTLPDAQQNQAYSYTLSPTSAYGSNTVSLVLGSLPTGMSLQSNGQITGTPSQSGTFSFSVKLTNSWDAAGAITTTRSYGLTVAASPAAPQNSSTGTTSTSTNTTSSATTQNSEPQILLNQDPGFTSDTGATIALAPTQVVQFTIPEATGTQSITPETHTITVSSVGDSFVDIVVASEPIHLRLQIGDVKMVDVDRDGRDDIAITLTGIAAGKANLVVKQLMHESSAVTATVQTQNKDAAHPQKAKSSNNSLYIPLGLFAALFVGIVSIILLTRKKKQETK